MFLDLHTHSERSSGNKSVYNIIIPEQETLVLEENVLPGCLSVGIHPWYINERHFDQQLIQLKNLAKLPQVKLIGECGLDRLRGPSFALQQKIFEEHLFLAEQLKKPLIIHCVKYFSELISFKKLLKPSIPLIIHGFNNNREILLELIRHGFYLSFGAALLSGNSNAFKLISQVPDKQLFLETSDKGIAIETIYQAAAEIKNIPVNILKDIIFANWMSLTEGSSMSS